MEKTIKEIYNISFDIIHISNENRCSMNDWYENLINKTYDQLDLFDVTRMIIQKIFLEIAVPKSIKYIKENLFCGQRYEGELIELLSKLDLVHIEKYRDDIFQILKKALVENETYEWLCEEERTEFFELINSFQKKLQLI